MTNKQFYRWSRMMAIFRRVFHCHQMPERSFFFKGMQFPLCARCTGIVIGFLLAPIPCVFLPLHMGVSIILVYLMFVDGWTQYIGLRESNNFIRLITGLGFGYAQMSFIFHIIERIIFLTN